MKAKFLLFIFIPILLLSGCARLQTYSSCENNPKNCLSLDAVNARVVRGEIGNVKPIALKKLAPAHFKSLPPLTTHSKPPARSPEKTLRIWIAPFEDKNHHYHEAHVIDTVVQASDWLGGVA